MKLAPPLLLATCALFAACAAQLDPVLKYNPVHHRNSGDITQCGSDQIGEVPAGTAITLQTVFIPPGQSDAEIKIDDNCSLYYMRLVGELVTVCDDVAPRVKLPAYDRAYVQRLGSIAEYAPVVVTQYCV